VASKKSAIPEKQSARVHHCDIAVIGAGPAGLSLACALKDSGLRVALIDMQSEQQLAEPAMDGRDIAMTHHSQTLLREIAVWPHFDADEIHPLENATVENGSSPYALHFEPEGSGKTQLGFLVANHCIRRALYQQAQTLSNIDWLLEQEVMSLQTTTDQAVVTLKNGDRVQAALAVSADSRFSKTRRMMGIGARMKDYGRVMLVCNMRHQRDHQHTARECFDYGHTCAILPLGEHISSIVVTVPAADADALMNLSAEDYTRRVRSLLNARLGEMELISERFAYPLVGAYADRFIARRYALIGDAAVGMHPVTAHGYNLGLRSACTLAELLRKAAMRNEDIAGKWLLRQYELRHQLIARPLYDSTNLIVRLYNDSNPAARLARDAAIRVGDKLAPFKKLVVHNLTASERLPFL
jgi:ubiquinone biosynthesis UbiH/UbiF/VisC/COQ6 family hydroxylase